jgi:hypothetical protein
MKSYVTPIISAAFLAFTGVATASPNPYDGKDEPRKEEPKKEKGKVKPYKLDTCIVSDEKLGEMGKPVVFVHEDQEIKLCCKDCRKDFDKEPAKYLKKLEEVKK